MGIFINRFQKVYATWPSDVILALKKEFRNHLGTDLSHLQLIGQNLMIGGGTQIQLSLIIVNVKRWSGRTRSWTLMTFSGLFEPSTARFIYRLSSFWKCLNPPKKRLPKQNTISVDMLKLCKCLHCIVSKSETKPDITPLLFEILVTYFRTHTKNLFH